jgi:hypothetical protein
MTGQVGLSLHVVDLGGVNLDGPGGAGLMRRSTLPWN